MGTGAYRVKNHINIQPQGSAPSNPTLGDIYCDTSGNFFRYDGATWTGIGGGGDGTAIAVAQPGHGFEVVDIGKAIRSSGVSGQYTFAQADSGANAEVVGYISAVSDENNFTYITGGKITGLSGLTTGEVYFLSPSTPGAVTYTEPSVVGQISKPCYIAISPTQAVALLMRGTTVGGTNLYTTIGLTGGTAGGPFVTSFHTINCALGSSQKLEGTIKIAVSSGTSYTIPFDIRVTREQNDTYTAGPAMFHNTIPSGLIVDNSGSSVRVTLPNVANFSSASVTYCVQSAANGTTLPVNVPSSQIAWSEPTMFRNRIINGDMRIDQRATAVSVSAQYTVDRWAFYKSNDATESVARGALTVTELPGFRYCLRHTVSVADSSIGATQNSVLEQKIEGYNMADLKWGTTSAKSVTLSFWVQAKKTGQRTGMLSNSDFSRCCPFQYTIDVADAWEYKTITLSGCTDGTWDNTNGTGLLCQFSIAMGTNYTTGNTHGVWTTNSACRGCGTPVNGLDSTANYFHITGVQLEPGTVATPFEFRPYSTELALCERYYEVCTGSYVGTGYGGYGGAQVTFRAKKRAAPTVTRLSDNQVNSITGSPYAEQITIEGFRATASLTGGAGSFSTQFSAEKEL